MSEACKSQLLPSLKDVVTNHIVFEKGILCCVGRAAVCGSKCLQ